MRYSNTAVGFPIRKAPTQSIPESYKIFPYARGYARVRDIIFPPLPLRPHFRQPPPPCPLATLARRTQARGRGLPTMGALNMYNSTTF